MIAVIVASADVAERRRHVHVHDSTGHRRWNTIRSWTRRVLGRSDPARGPEPIRGHDRAANLSQCRPVVPLDPAPTRAERWGARAAAVPNRLSRCGPIDGSAEFLPVSGPQPPLGWSAACRAPTAAVTAGRISRVACRAPDRVPRWMSPPRTRPIPRGCSQAAQRFMPLPALLSAGCGPGPDSRDGGAGGVAPNPA